MSKVQGQNQIEEALSLIEVLEQLSTCLSESNLSARDIAWGGYLQTFTEIKRKLSLALDSSDVEHNFDSSKKNEDDDMQLGREVVSSSIAKRIKKLPPVRSGKVRELSSESSNGEFKLNDDRAVSQQDVLDPNV